MYKRNNYNLGLSPLEKTTYTVGLKAYVPELQGQELLLSRAKNPQAYESILKNYYKNLMDYIKGTFGYDSLGKEDEISTLEKNITSHHKDLMDKKPLDPRTHRAFPLGPEAAIIIDIGLNPTGLTINSYGKIEPSLQ